MEFRAVTFHEAHGSPVYQLADDQARLTRDLACAWDDQVLLAANLVGWPQLVTEGAVTYISRVLPHGYPGIVVNGGPDDGKPILWATAVNRLRGDGRSSAETPAGDGTTRYDAPDVGEAGVPAGAVPPAEMTARLLVEYRSPLYDVRADADCLGTGSSALVGKPDEGTLKRFVERYFEPAFKAQTVPKNLFRTVETTPRPVEEPPTKVHATANLVYVHRMRPDLPMKAIQAAVGKLNSTVFDAFGAPPGYPAGTLLCLPPRVRPYVSALGQRLYDLRFAFALAYNVDAGDIPRGWNGPWVTRTDGTIDYTEISLTGTAAGGHLYKTYDMTKLFQPDQAGAAFASVRIPRMPATQGVPRRRAAGSRGAGGARP